MAAYYNENDPFAVAWLRELIAERLIADGVVDERSITEVSARDLRRFDQCHFFAGIGVWSYALQSADWSDERNVWTGSCPCQPFPAAGKQAGFDDSRHLWPIWFDLIRECRPAVVFGEQVASATSWIDLVQGNMEDEDYAFGKIVLGAHSIGAPHIRQRTYWVGHTDNAGLQGRSINRNSPNQRIAGPPSVVGRLADSGSARIRDSRRSQDASASNSNQEKGLQRKRLRVDSRHDDRRSTLWSACDWLPCRDKRYRPVEPGTFPLVNGTPNRVGRLRGYGNAIVAPLAAAFIEAYKDTVNENNS